MKIGDLILVTNSAFFEKAEIVEKSKGIYTLSNGIKMDATCTPLNSKYKLEPFDKDKYELLLSKGTITRCLVELNSLHKHGMIDGEDAIKTAKKLLKLVNKLKK